MTLDLTMPKGEIERLRAELDAQRARANANEMCAAAVVEIRRVCAEIMGGNMAFVDDDFARCLLTLRDERDALAKDAARYRWLKSVYFTPGKSAFALVGPTRSASELDATIDAALAEEARTRGET